MRTEFLVSILLAALIMAFILPPPVKAQATALTLQPNTRYQVITGWEATAFAYEIKDLSRYQAYKNSLLTAVVNDMGINRIRLEIRSSAENTTNHWQNWVNAGAPDTGDAYIRWRCHRYSTINDDSNPQSVDAYIEANPTATNIPGYHFSELDHQIENLIIPLKQKIEANGEQLLINLNYVSFTGQMSDPRCTLFPNLSNHHATVTNGLRHEYAELILAAFHHLKNKYSLVPDYLEMYLEPDNVSNWGGAGLAEALIPARDKLAAHGFNPKFIVPSTTQMGNAAPHFSQMVNQIKNLKGGSDQYVRDYVEELSYHRYGTAPFSDIVSAASTYGIKTSMLEWWDTGNTYQILHDDLKHGNNSAWQEGTLLGIYTIDNNNQAIISHKSKFIRQYMKYIRSGAQRIEVSSTNRSLDPLAFINPGNKFVIVSKIINANNFSISGPPAATYGISYTTGGDQIELTPQTISSSNLNINLPSPITGVITIYAKSAGDNSPTATNVIPTATSTPSLRPFKSRLPIWFTSQFDTNADGLFNILDWLKLI